MMMLTASAKNSKTAIGSHNQSDGYRCTQKNAMHVACNTRHKRPFFRSIGGEEPPGSDWSFKTFPREGVCNRGGGGGGQRQDPSLERGAHPIVDSHQCGWALSDLLSLLKRPVQTVHPCFGVREQHFEMIKEAQE